MNSKCSVCGSINVVKIIEDFDSRELDSNGENIIIKEVRSHMCYDCKDTWINHREIKRIRDVIKSKKGE